MMVGTTIDGFDDEDGMGQKKVNSLPFLLYFSPHLSFLIFVLLLLVCYKGENE